MSDALMGNEAKPEPEDLSSVYDLEYRANEDDAWYSVCVVLDANAETLTVKYLCSPEVYEAVFPADGFETEAKVEELVGRFRPLSQQLQDHQCGKLSIGTTVCAAHGTGDDDLRFYDAVIEAVRCYYSSLFFPVFCHFKRYFAPAYGKGCPGKVMLRFEVVYCVENQMVKVGAGSFGVFFDVTLGETHQLQYPLSIHIQSHTCLIYNRYYTCQS